MYFRISRFVLKPEGVSIVRDAYEKDVMGPAMAAKGNHLFCVLHSADNPREGLQITGWDSKEDCDRYLKETFPKVFKKFESVFEVKPQATFWELKWPAKIQF